MAIAELKELLSKYSIDEKRELAHFLLEDISKDIDDAWLTPVVEQELNRRAQEGIKNPQTNIPYEKVMTSIRNRKN